MLHGTRRTSRHGLAAHPTTRGTTAQARTASAQATCATALARSPAKATTHKGKLAPRERQRPMARSPQIW
jgi:hypothetical protein